jgi:protein-tyrosine phosphatase
MFPGVMVIHVPLEDHLITPKEWQAALRVADDVASLHEQGAKVLVTCMLGLNRSGLITALTIHRLTGIGGHAAEKLVRSKRRMSLFNPSFVRSLRSVRPIR